MIFIIYIGYKSASPLGSFLVHFELGCYAQWNHQSHQSHVKRLEKRRVTRIIYMVNIYRDIVIYYTYNIYICMYIMCIYVYIYYVYIYII